MRAALLTVIFGLLLSACGGTEADADRVSLSLTTSPINDLLGIDIALRAGDLVALEQQAEVLVVECMLANGFEYVAIDFASQFQPGAGQEDPDTRAYAEANGYGISIRPDLNTPSPEEIVDPNDEIRAALSASELEAYQEALFGEAPVEEQPIDPANQTGCVAESYRNVFAAQNELGNVEQFFGDFAAELSDLESRFRADPRFIELEAQWATCMNEQGFSVSTRDEVFVELDRRMVEVGARFGPGEEPDAATQQAMDDVADWERRAAVADWDCTEPVREGMETLRFGYEALFLDENRDRLPAG